MTITDSSLIGLFGHPARKGDPPPPISNLDDWFDYGAPKGGEAQWVELRSAYELARAWCAEGGVEAPADFLTLLATHPLLNGLRLTSGYVEHKTALRGERRGPRVHDLLLIASSDAGKVVIGVEGKADESFDRPLQKRWDEAHKQGQKTNWPARLKRLTPALLGVEAATPDGRLNPEIAGVPYQLLSALAGTLIEAEDRGAVIAVFVAHVFTSTATRPEQVGRNGQVFADFVGRIGRIPANSIKDGALYGPFDLPGGEWTRMPSDIPILLGKVTTEVPAQRPRPRATT